MKSNHSTTAISLRNVSGHFSENGISTICISYKGVCFANAFVDVKIFSDLATIAQDINTKISELDDATLITEVMTQRGYIVASPNPLLEEAGN